DETGPRLRRQFQLLPQRGERRAEAVASGLQVALRPEHLDQGLPRVRAPGMESQVGKQEARLLSAKAVNYADRGIARHAGHRITLSRQATQRTDGPMHLIRKVEQAGLSLLTGLSWGGSCQYNPTQRSAQSLQSYISRIDGS